MVVGALTSPVVLAVGSPVSALDNGRIPAGGVLRITVPEAIGGKTVVGQLTVDRVDAAGYVTAYGCDDDFPFDLNGNVGRSDLNYDGTVSPVASNRLIVKADNNGDVCFFTLRAAAIIVDVNAVTFDTGINSFPNRRTDTRTGSTPLRRWRCVARAGARGGRRQDRRRSADGRPRSGCRLRDGIRMR